jgi:hypothetical protein
MDLIQYFCCRSSCFSFHFTFNFHFLSIPHSLPLFVSFRCLITIGLNSNFCFLMNLLPYLPHLVYLFSLLVRYCLPNHFSIPLHLTLQPILYFRLFYLLFLPANCPQVPMSLPIVHLFQHLLLFLPQLFLYHFSYPALALNCQPNPFVNLHLFG